MIDHVPEIRVSQPRLKPTPVPPFPKPPEKTVAAPDSEVRRFLLSRGNSVIADRGFQWLMVLCAFSIFGIVVLIATQLVKQSHLSWVQFGLRFFFQADIDPSTKQRVYWDPVTGTSARCHSFTAPWFRLFWRC